MIKEAIIPLAGLGTRLLPFTKILPKELLPLGKKTILEHILDECLEAGIKKIILVISKRKKFIKDYLSSDHYLLNYLKKKKDYKSIQKLKILDRYRNKIKFVYQNKTKGTGDAVLKTKKYIKDKYFLMLLPDDLIIKKNCSKSMIGVHKKFKTSVMASMKVNKNDVSRWGIYSIRKKIDKNNFIINNVVEKPSIKTSPSNNAVIGRYILPKTIFSKLKSLKPGKSGEFHITDAIQALIEDDNQFIGHNFSGKYLDCGTMKGYIKSTLEISKQ